MINELIVFSGNTSYNIDLYDNETIDLTKSITDIIDPEQRRSDYTRTIKVPGSANNNKVFSFIFDLSRFTINTTQTQFNPDFNASVKTSAILYRNGIVQMKGFLELTNIVKRPDGSHDYEIVMYGEVADLFKDMGEKKLTDLDLSEFDHVLNLTDVDTTSHTQADGYIYPIIDDGLAALESQYYIDKLSPATYVKTLIDKIFSAIGYTYNSTFFNSNLFKRLVLWCGDNPAQYLTSQQIANAYFRAEKYDYEAFAPIPLLSSANRTRNIVYNYTDTQSTPAGYDNTTGEFTIKYTGYYSFYANISYDIKNVVVGTAPSTNIIGRLMKYDGTKYTVLGTSIWPTTPIPYLSTDFGSNFINTNPIYCEVGDIVYFEVVMDSNPSNRYEYSFGSSTGLQLSGWFYNTPLAQRVDNGSISLNKFLPSEMTQVEFMTNLKNMFNLYFEPDPIIPKKLRIEPRDDYYTNTVVDLTSKVDVSKDIVVNPLELAKYKTYIYQYDKDNDEYNAMYNATSKYTYGFRKFDINNQFLKDTKEIKVTFAPTPVSYTPNWHTRVFSKVRYKNTNNTYDKKVAKGRILYANVLPSGPINPIQLLTRAGSTITLNNYQYAGHLDDPNASTFDLSFGNPEVVYYEPSGYTQNNLFNKYWRKNILEITDPDSKVVEVSLKLNEYEVKDLTFDKMYLIDRLYYRLIEVNYNVAGYDTVQCKFFQSLNYPNWVDLPSNPTNGGSEIFYGDDGKVIGEAPVYGGTEARGDNGFVENSNNTTYGQNNKMGSQTDNTIINSQGNNYAGEYINVLGGGGNQVYASNVNLLNCSGYISSIEGEQVINNIQQPFYAASAFTRYDVSGIGTTPVCVIPKYEGYFIEVTGLYGQVTFGVGDSTGYSSEKVKIKYGPTGVTIGEIATGLSTATTDKRYTGTLFADIASEEEAVFITSGSEGLTGGNGNIKIEVYYRLIKK